jgi:tetratricopeptide (TPR) repeat protein
MIRPVSRLTLAASLVLVASIIDPILAEQGVLVVHVSDVTGKVLPRVRLATKGAGGVGAPTDVAGRARIALAPQTKPQTIVELTIVSPADLAFISPWDNRVPVPPFDNESQNFASVVLAPRGERALLENGKVVNSVVARLNLSTSAKERTPQPPVQPADALAQAAATLGLPAADVDAAIQAWAQRTSDPYDQGMIALYGGNLADATAKLTAALTLREQRLQSGSREAADAAFFLGHVFYRQAQYVNAAVAYRKALAYRPGDPATTNNLGLTLLQAGDYSGAEPMLRLAIATIEAAKGPDDPDVVFALNNLGSMLLVKGDLAAAEAALRRGLEIRRKALGATDVRTANSMTNVASVLLARGNDNEAESLLMTALDIFDAGPAQSPKLVPGANPLAQPAIVAGGALGSPGRAAVRLNQAIHARHRNPLAESKTNAEEVLRSQPQTAAVPNQEAANATLVLAQAELAGGEIAMAIPHFENAIEVLQSVIGVRHPALADALTGLGDAASRAKDNVKAEASYRRAIAIRRSTFGNDDAIAAEINRKLSSLGQ